MKNTHIKAGEEVPIELRKEVYREALEIIETNKDMDYGLCYFLLMVLYGSDVAIHDHPTSKKILNFYETKYMFPELKKYLKNGFCGNYTRRQRINFLKSVI